MTGPMRPFTSTISVTEALAAIRAHVRPVATVEQVGLEDAAWRVVAGEVRAAGDVPPFDRAAMDGYAVRATDTSSPPATLRCVGVAFAGQPLDQPVTPGTCAEIATGAPVPAGADAVVMVERTTRDGELITVHEAVRTGQHIGPRGNDARAGDVVVSAGEWLTPARLGAVAAVGVDRVTVFARPSLAIASTGNEVVAPGRALAPGQIHDVNRFTLPAVAGAHGAAPRVLPTVADSLEGIRAALDAAAGADLVVFTGGSSVGTRDLVADVVAERGTIVFHGVAMKPGKPTLFARLRRGGDAAVEDQLFLGLSGNPTSCLSNAYILMVPLLRQLARLPAWRPLERDLPLAHAVTPLADRHQFLPVRVDGDRVAATFKGSGEITSLSRADGYVEIPAGASRIDAGTVVRVVLF